MLAAETFNFVSSHGCTWLECGTFAEVPWLVHAFGTRQAGELKPKPAGQDSAASAGAGPARAEHKRRRFLQALGVGDLPLAVLHQTHSTLIYCVSPGSGGALQYALVGSPLLETGQLLRARSGDATITQYSGILLGVRAADCMPILIVDRDKQAIAAVHAGWRGSLNRIVEKTAGEMCRMFNSRPEDLMVAIGPSIRQCCYEVGPELVRAFCGSFPAAEEFFCKVPAKPEESAVGLRHKTPFMLQAPPGHQPTEQSGLHLDLAAVARWQLEHAGIPQEQIYVSDYCTACRTDLFFSYRKEGNLAGRMMAVIGMQPGELS